ncbi:MAG TPA: ATP-binding protein [Planctomycetaceae bacterium]|jgi:PAS domain S-box-containing protein
MTSPAEEAGEDRSDVQQRNDLTRGRLHAGTLCTEIWHALAGHHDQLEIFRRWAESLSHYLGHAVVGIWLRDPHSSTLALQVVVGGTAADFGPAMQLTRADVELVLSTQEPRTIRDLAADARWRDQLPFLGRNRIIALAVHPLVSQGGTAGAVVAFIRRNCDAVQLHLLRSAIDEMSCALSRLGTEARLRQSHAALRTIMHSAPLGLVGLDLSGNITLWNRDAERMFGWSEKEVMGRSFAATAMVNAAEFQEWVKCALRGRATRQFEAQGQCRDAGRREIGVTLAPQYAEGSTVAGLIAVIVDIHERKQSARRLSMQHKVSRILKVAPAAESALSQVIAAICLDFGCERGDYWQVDRETDQARITAAWCLPAGVNAAADKINAEKMSPEKTTAEKSTEVRLLHDDEDFVASVYRQGRPAWIQELPCDRRNPAEHPATRQFLMRAAIGLPVRLSGNDVAGIFLLQGGDVLEPESAGWESLENVAEQVAQFLLKKQTESTLAVAEENLRQSQKMEAIGLLAGGVAHDFNNLLTVIIGHSEIGQETWPADIPLRDLLREIEMAGKRAAGLTRQLLAFSRKQPIDPVVFNINRQVAEMERLLQSLIGKEIDLQTSLTPDVYPVKADPAQFEQVILNLVVNARDAMPHGGRLTIHTENEHLDRPLWRDTENPLIGAFVVLAVSDTGCGMSEETRKRIFEPFFTTKALGRGTGMGLATVFGIVKQSGGGITVASEPGQGTTFKVYLPRAHDVLTAWNVDSPPPSIPDGTETVLVVDDEDGVRAVVSALLRVRGYTVLGAAGGAAALKICRSQRGRLALVISDVIMPGMTGDELARQIVAEYPKMKLLQMSGFAGHALAAAESKSPRVPFLQKPFTSEALARKVREVLDHC